MKNIKPSDAWKFYELCQEVVDNMLMNDIHELEYGKPYKSVSAKALCGVIAELELRGALKRIEGTTRFTLDPSVYRIFFSRHYSTLVKDQKRQDRQFLCNVGLMACSIISAFFSGYACYGATKEKAEKEIKQENYSPAHHQGVKETKPTLQIGETTGVVEGFPDLPDRLLENDQQYDDKKTSEN